MLVGEAAELTSAVAAGLTQDGYRIRQILPGSQARQVSGTTYTADLNCEQSLQQLRSLLTGTEKRPIGALINFLGISAAGTAATPLDSEAARQITVQSFQLVKLLAEDLTTAAAEGGGWVLNLSGLDGQFGLSGNDRSMVLASAGLNGLFKSLRQEYPRLSVRNIDLDLSMPNPLLAGRLIEELATEDSAYEIGLTANGRWTLQLTRSTPHATQLGEFPLDRDSVVLITGGAYGITCDIAQRLGERSQAHLILVGRSPLPEQEAESTRGLDAAKLRLTLIAERKAAGEPLVPAQIEQDVKRILKNRQILQNLADLEATGARIEYHSLDVRNPEAFGNFIDDLYIRYGRLDGVIHGAGVIEDKRIPDKSVRSYTNVFSTKVDSACILAERLRPESLKFLVFFSSVSGRFGNQGQADYSAANEFLNKLADHLDRQWPGRVVAVNWGAWDAGMVSDELRKIYASRNIHLIPVDEGVRFLEQELRLSGRREPEVTIGCSVPQLAQLVQGV